MPVSRSRRSSTSSVPSVLRPVAMTTWATSAGRTDRAPHPVGEPVVVVDDRAVDVEAHQRAPGPAPGQAGAHTGTSTSVPRRAASGGGTSTDAVGLLVVLQQRDEPARGGQRPVEGGDRGGAALAAHPDVQAAGLEGRAVARRGQLEPARLRRQPGLAVELAGGAAAQVARGHVDHPVGQPEGGEHPLLQGQHPLVLGRGVRGVAEGEHLDLVELVDADDAAGVLAVAAGLAAVAGRPAGVADRPVRQVEDLVGVVAGQRDLARADQVQVVRGQAVDLVGVRAQEAGAGHDLRPHQGRGDHRREARLERGVHGQAEQGELQPGADAGEEVEPAAGDLGAALHVDRAQPLGHGQVVRHGAVRADDALGHQVADLADLAQHDVVVLAARGHARQDDVVDPAQRRVEGLLGRVDVGLRGLDVVGQLLGRGDQGGLLVLRCLGDQAPGRLLLRAQGLEPGDGLAPGHVRGQGGVDRGRVRAPAGLAVPGGLRVLAQRPDVDHWSITVASLRAHGLRRRPAPLGSGRGTGALRGRQHLAAAEVRRRRRPAGQVGHGRAPRGGDHHQRAGRLGPAALLGDQRRGPGTRPGQGGAGGRRLDRRVLRRRRDRVRGGRGPRRDRRADGDPARPGPATCWPARWA